MGERSLQLLTRSPEETDHIGLLLGRGLSGGEAIALVGTLGAGKTRLVKAIAEGMGFDPRDVVSPTFLLIHEHLGPVRLIHVDAYRTSGAEELTEAGGGDIFADDAVAVVEWADIASGFLPADHLEIEIEIVSESGRRLLVRAFGPRSRADLERMESALSAGGTP